MIIRPTWNEYFMQMAKLASNRSTCLRRQVGAVLVKDNVVIGTGYNGAPKGMDHCEQTGCIRDELKVPSGERHELCRAVHAEQNAIIQCARLGNACVGSKLYCTHHPCSICAKMIVNAGIHTVVYCEGYPDEEANNILIEAGVSVGQFN